MIEEQEHIEAFEEFYALGGTASDENVRYLAGKCQVSERTIWRWYKEFSWKQRVKIRNNIIRRELEKKTTTTIAENKAKYLSYGHKLFDEWKILIDKGENPVKIKSVSDYCKITELSLKLQE